jgi:hypothetical protein
MGCQLAAGVTTVMESIHGVSCCISDASRRARWDWRRGRARRGQWGIRRA